MPRTIDWAAHATWRHLFFDAAARLVQARGYERMTIQDLLDAVQLSKGAFYHYFDSKDALLAGLVEHLAEVGLQQLTQVIGATDQSATDKLQRLFQELVRRKREHKGFQIALFRVWYSDGNIVVRQRMESLMRVRMRGVLSNIIRQGGEEGVFETRHPDMTGRMVVALLQDINDIFIEQWHAAGGSVDRRHVEQTVEAYNDAVERILGVTAGSLPLLDPAQVWAVVERPAGGGDDVQPVAARA